MVSAELSLHPLVAAAAEGRFPEWTQAREARRDHMARVATLMGGWARARGASPLETARWMAAANLHDALRDADPEELRPRVDPTFRDYPGKILHGPAVAFRLKEEGVADRGLLHAIAFHTLGAPDFEEVGLALFSADFLEPGRRLREKWRAGLRKKFPGEMEKAVREILGARLKHQLDRGRPLRAETVAFWNRMAEGEGWASASEL